jgi:nucleoid DNA-binding protein
MPDKTKGRDQLINILQEDLPPVINQTSLTKKEVEAILGVVIQGIEKTLLQNLDINGFSLKLNQLAKLTVRHKAGIIRKIPFNGETTLTKDKRKIKLVILGKLRENEIVK